MIADRFSASALLLAAALLSAPALAAGQAAGGNPPPGSQPWRDRSLPAEERAAMALKEMTLEEKLGLLHGNSMPGWSAPRPNAHLGNGGAGFVLGVPRLGIPIIQMSDAAYGVRSSAENGRYSTALPAPLAAAASWDTDTACQYGALIGRELRAQGYNMTLGGGTNLAREPRNGRNFEYQGEDPVLAGTLVGSRIRCEGAEHVLSDIKHYAVNDQESGRNQLNAVIGRRALRESDLLAFEIGVETGHPSAVMCSYNAVNGDFACENRYLLTDVLKKEWQFPGFVVSDWGGTHSTEKASAAGLDNEEPEDLYFGARMKAAVEAGRVPMAELDEHVGRILRSEFASGIVDHPVTKSVVDVEAGFETARRIEESSIVLLRNQDQALPLDSARLRSIAVIGPHADTGMISGGGSAQVDPMGGRQTPWQAEVWFPTSPLRQIAARAPAARVEFASGEDPAAAEELARRADVAIVFAYKWSSEAMDQSDLSLPHGQDALIARVAAANRHTVVVLETGNPVLMPWLDRTAAVLEAWYGGSKGADAVAGVLFGAVNPSAKLPITFPAAVSDLPHPRMTLPPPGVPADLDHHPLRVPIFDVKYDEGLEVGYKWYDARRKKVLFPFGFGLSYTSFAYSGLSAAPDGSSVTFTVANTGQRQGVEIAEVYAALPAAAAEPPKRLVGWARVSLEPGQKRELTVAIPRKYLSTWEEGETGGWKLLPGEYTLMVGGSSQDLPLARQLTLR